MVRAIGLRLLGAIPVLFLVAFGIFALIRLAPGDAATTLSAEDASAEDIQRLRVQWGLDQPIWMQFLLFLYRVAHLDFGISYRYGEPVSVLIGARLPATIELSTLALLTASLIAVPLGTLAALRKGRFADSVTSIVAVSGVSAPHFWIGILLVLLFSAFLNLLPSGGRLPYGAAWTNRTGLVLIDTLIAGQYATFWLALQHLMLPALTLALGMIGIIARITRSAVIDVGQEEFIFTAVAKGLSRAEIVRRHIMPNASIPIVTIIGLELGVLISGSIIVEVVFSWPGVGSLLYGAVTVRDVPLTTGIVVAYTAIFIGLNVLVDVAYLMVDPRLRAG
jgi:peptide/nickel transport system permease protein